MAVRTQSESASPLDPPTADRPIETLDDDLLGRKDVALALARAIAGWRSNESLVLAIYGEWGSGKSSLKNMALDALKKGVVGPNPDRLEFNPWNYQGADEIAAAFFRQLAIALGREPDRGRKVAATLRRYAAGLQVVSSASGRVRQLAVALIAAAAALGGGALVDSLRLVGAGVGVVLFALVVAVVFVVQGLLEGVAQLIESRQSTVGELKAQLTQELTARKRTLLVVMDDLDRLSPTEVRRVFQLVKANADLPHIVYLLLFERVAVERSLEADAQISGRDFLQKIVQVGLDVPAADQTRINKVLFKGLDEILKEPSVQGRFEESRWADMYLSALQPYFDSLRDVYRYLSTLRFYTGILLRDGVFSVNTIDLIAIETLRMFEPELHHRMATSRETLTAERHTGDLRAVQETEIRGRIDGILATVAEPQVHRARSVLVRLFPNLAWALEPGLAGGETPAEWFRTARVCHPDRFDLYFQLTPAEGTVSQGDLELAISLAGNRPALQDHLKRVIGRGLMLDFVTKFDAYKEDVPIGAAVPFVTALFDVGDDLPRETPGIFTLGADSYAGRIIYWFLLQEPDAERRADHLDAAIRQTDGLYLPVYVVRTDASRTTEPGKRLIPEGRLPTIQRSIVDRIHVAEDAGRLIANLYLASILFFWREVAGDAEPSAFVRRALARDEDVIRLVRAFTTTIRSSSGRGVRRTPTLKLSNLETFAAIDQWQTAVDRAYAQAAADDRTALESFHRAVRKRNRGISEDSPTWMHDDDESG